MASSSIINTKNKEFMLTCTVAFGSQAIGINKRSLRLRLVPKTARKLTTMRTTSPIVKTPMPFPATMFYSIHKLMQTRLNVVDIVKNTRLT